MALNSLLCSLRERTHKTQTAAAAAVGVGPSTICKWENGSNTPSLPLLLRALKAFGATKTERERAIDLLVKKTDQRIAS